MARDALHPFGQLYEFCGDGEEGDRAGLLVVVSPRFVVGVGHADLRDELFDSFEGHLPPPF